jgi:hypothetical protein
MPGTITNNAVNRAYVNTFTVTITQVLNAAQQNITAACGVANFGVVPGSTGVVLTKGAPATVQTLTLPVTTELGVANPNDNSDSVAFPAFTIGVADDSANSQDACKGAAPQLSYSTN